MLLGLLPFALLATQGAAYPQIKHTGVNEFRAPRPSDSRSPCPILNTLANHGYLPRNGKGITMDAVKTQAQAIFGLGPDLATALSQQAFQVLGGKDANGTALFGPIDLNSAGLLGFIEHDASLSFADPTVDDVVSPSTIDQLLVKDLFAHSSDGRTLLLEDIAKVRVEREAIARRGPLSATHIPVALTESAVVLSVFGDIEKVAIAPLQDFLGKNKLPFNFTPVRVVDLTLTRATGAEIAASMAEIRAQQ